MLHQDPFPFFIPTSTSYEKGKFGRIFPWLPPCTHPNESFVEEFIQIARNLTPNQNSNMPAGYTYLGQFIAHDLSFDPTSLKERLIDTEQLNNFRTPALDLDSMYGSGPSVMPYLYRSLIENEQDKIWGEFDVDALKPEVPRIYKHGTALIADHRNDENIVLTNLHAAFMAFHNAMLQKYKYVSNRHTRFQLARRDTTWHYQWIILHDFLPRIAGEEVVSKVLKKRKFFTWRNEPFIPLEFSAAVFRFGHTQVRSSYVFKTGSTASKIFTQNKSEIPVIDWPLFFFNDLSTNSNVNFKIGPGITGELTELSKRELPLEEFSRILVEKLANRNDRQEIMEWIDPGFKILEQHLAFRNLYRGHLLHLPSGQDVARAMKKEPIDVEVADFPKRLKKNTPLWYYILEEAMVEKNGESLGSVGGRLVAEVLIGILQGDKTSFLNHDPKWQPTSVEGSKKPNFNMVDFLRIPKLYGN